MRDELSVSSTSHRLLYLGSEDLVSIGLYDWPRAMRDIERAFASLGQGDAAVAPKPRLKVPDSLLSWVGYIGCLGRETHRVSIKWLTRFMAKDDIPGPIEGILILSDSTSGKLLAVMQAGKLTAVRTAATSALACGYLAKREASTLAVLGAGVQAAHHICALTSLRPSLRRVLLWNRSPARTQALLDEIEPLHLSELKIVKTIEEAVTEGEVVVCAISAEEPVLDAGWLVPGALLIDLRGGDWESAVVSRSDSVFVDWRGNIPTGRLHALYGGTDEDHERSGKAGGDLVDLIAGRISYERGEKDRVFFASTGVAIEDLALASRMYDEALRQGAGLWLNLS